MPRPVTPYIPYIDGLRGIAVLSILFFHLDMALFKGGFVGVDIFFVISGYLITGHIVSDLQDHRFSLPGFYARRIKRIFPALFCMLFVTSLAAIAFLGPQEFSEFFKAVRYSGAQISNILFAQDIDYFAPDQKTNPLLHTWSLGVEEQFYLVWPLILIGLFKYNRTQNNCSILCAIAIISLLISQYLVLTDAKNAFYMLHSRTWELAAGGVAALAPLARPLSPKIAETVSALCLGIILLCVFGYNEHHFPGIKAVPPCLATAGLFYIARHGETFTHRMIGTRILTALGLISFGVYLWHWPFIAFYKSYFSVPLTTNIIAVIVPLTLVFAYISYRWIETPVRNGTFKPWAVIAVALSCIVVTVIASNIMKREDNAAWRTTMAIDRKVSEANPYFRSCSHQGDAYDKKKCIIGPHKDRYEVLLTGDSHASHYAPAVIAWAEERGLTVRLFIREACRTFITSDTPVMRYGRNDEGCMAMRRDLHDILKQDTHIQYVFLALFGQDDPDILTSLDRIQTYGKKTYYLGRVPVFARNPLECQIRAHLLATKIFPRDGSQCLHLDMDDASQRMTGVRTSLIPHLERLGIGYFDPAPALVPPFDRDGHFLYMDDHHLNIYGGLHLWPYLDEFTRTQALE